MIDLWKLTGDYHRGDFVQKIDFNRGGLSPFMGRVTAVHPGLGVLDVQWPFGNYRENPDELVRVNTERSLFLPPEFDQSFDTYDKKQAEKWEAKRATASTLWPSLGATIGGYKDLAEQWYRGANEVAAYDTLYRRHGSAVDDEILREATRVFYARSITFGSFRILQALQKEGAYWVRENRTYKATREDVERRAPGCPKCGTLMRSATYKMSNGKPVRLFACHKDLFLIRKDDLLGPSGEVVSW